MFRRFLFFLFLIVGCCSVAHAANELARALNDAFVSVYDTVSPSVAILEIQRSGADGLGIPPVPSGRESDFPSQGSAIILSADGFLVTNYHVIAGAEPEGIFVILKDGRRFSAKVIGFDEKTDIAVLQIDADGLPSASLGDSSQVRVGQLAFAIGAPMELPYTFTFGIISATGRTNLTRSTPYENYLQTDAAINPGNSGGPLCDLDGRVIGMNTLINGMSRSLGFAIPVNQVREICTQLITNGQVVRPWIGISIEGIQENPQLRSIYSQLAEGVVVQAIFFNSPASRSELRAGDVILRVDGGEVRRAGDVQKAVLAHQVGDKVALQIWRNGGIHELIIESGEQPTSFTKMSSSPVLIAPTTALPPPHSKESPTIANLGLELHALTSQERASLKLSKEDKGVLITQVMRNSPAAAAGLLVGDIITHLGTHPLHSLEDATAQFQAMNLERGAMLSLIREGKKTFAMLKP